MSSGDEAIGADHRNRRPRSSSPESDEAPPATRPEDAVVRAMIVEPGRNGSAAVEEVQDPDA
jgi:hypothetical protein